MANHMQLVKLDGSLTKEQIISTLKDINNDLFDGLLPIQISEDMLYIGLCVSVQPYGNGGIHMWIEEDYDHYDNDENHEVIKGTYLDIKQGHGSDFYWWLDHLIICELGKRLGLLAFGEGFGHSLDEPRNYDYRMFKESLYKPYKKMTLPLMLANRFNVRITKQFMKNDLSPELYKYVFNMK